ncbi:MAG: MGMT family protein, partial [Proteobacteria bacterium]|nr:MGMT family protein [Pseudomonadota bacterium]
PFPVVVPCHRVIKSDGSCGGFGGGKDLKMRMLALEKGNPSTSGFLPDK